MELYYLHRGNTVWQSITDFGVPRYGDFVEADGREYRVQGVKWILTGERRVEVEVTPWDAHLAGLMNSGPEAEVDLPQGLIG